MTAETATGASGYAGRKRGRFWFEYPDTDLPFYNGKPVALSAGKWLAVMAGVALGFAALVAPVPALRAGLAGFAPSLLFVALPLATLAIVAPGAWRSLFRPIGPRDVFWMAAFALLNIAVTVVVGYLVQRVLGANANPMFGQLAAMSPPDHLLFFIRTIPQLMGEEVLTILPFLAVVTLLYGGAGLSRRWAIIGAWIASGLLFGAVHLPTYGWNLAQCLLIIGAARLVLTLPYVMTKNIWVATGAHILNDWTLFGTVALLAGRS